MSFEQKTWYNKDSNGNIPDGAPRYDADNMNRIEGGIAENKTIIDILKPIVDKMFASYVKSCDFSNKIHTITGSGTIWTATQDCWVSLYGQHSMGNASEIYIDGVLACRLSDQNSYSSDRSINQLSPIYVRKGATVKLSHGGYAEIRVYGCIE